MRSGTTPDFSSAGRAYGCSPFTEGGHHGRRSDGLTGDLRRLPGERSLDQRLPAGTRKLPGAFSGVPHPKMLPALSQRTSCPREDRQHDIVYEPPGEVALSPVTTGTQTDPLERQASPLSENDTSTGCYAPRDRITVKRCTTLFRLDSSSKDRESAVGALRRSRVKSVRKGRKCSMTAVLFNARFKRTVRRGSTRTRLTSGSSVHVPTPGSVPLNSGQSERATPHTYSDVSTLARNIRAGGDISAVVRAAVAAPTTQGQIVSGGGGDPSPTPRARGTMGLTREWYNLNTVGLPQKVINTIQSARASSTRSLYDCKWRVFEEWCLQEGHISFQCPVGVILSFLQDLIDKHRAFTTIKVYLAAIAACHVGFEGKTASQHPLVCRFMKGAHRLLPVSRSLVPLWDRALHTYMDRSKELRLNDQLFVSWAKPHKGKPVTKQRLSHWIVEAIALAYTSQNLQAPLGLRAHSTRGLATSWALFKGVSIQDICAAASWSSPLTFVRFYRLDVSAPSVARAVLGTLLSRDSTC
ncbi:hypothetical protein CesoFtcFv8_001280 [Champsocephalus esox]|uniref:Tyr recombinase domain-containing protein n=1 Tax=Champsocephalus esox TaxID=159716 RepID=A0AAN8HKL2_9TELE|nr:hypothetical protein CesoFtcFv8_001280 [Champsocephalus esox]